MNGEVILRNRESAAVRWLTMKQDGSLWTDPGSKTGARKVFDSLAQATAQGWRVQEIGLPVEVFDQ